MIVALSSAFWIGFGAGAVVVAIAWFSKWMLEGAPFGYDGDGVPRGPG